MTTASCTLTEDDAVSWLRRLPDECADCVITDPAYESLEKHRARGTTTRLKQSAGSSNVWFPVFPNARFGELFAELYRVMRKDSHLYVFCDQETMFVAKPEGEKAGFKFWKGLVWDKVHMGMGYHYRCRFEHVLFFEKGKRRLADLGIEDVIRCPRVRGGYPTEKPPLVSRVLVEQSTVAGELVLDPFMGSGSVGEACLPLGRSFWGCDISKDALQHARVRLSRLPDFADTPLEEALARSRRQQELSF